MKGEGAKQRSVLGQSQFRMSIFTLVTGCSHCVHTDTGLKECSLFFLHIYTERLLRYWEDWALWTTI